MKRRWIWQHPAWPQFQWDTEALVPSLVAARLAMGRLQGMWALLPPHLRQEALQEAVKAEVIGSSAIEGILFPPEEVAAAAAEFFGPPRKGRGFDRTVYGSFAVVANATWASQEPLTGDMLRHWHKTLFPESWNSAHILVGHLRRDEVAVMSGPPEKRITHFEAVTREHLDEDLEQFLAWFNTESRDLEPVLRAGIAHLWFLILHPFEDGNGRLGRALLDRALAQDHAQEGQDCPQGSNPLLHLSTAFLGDQQGYYGALRAAQSYAGGMDVTGWLTWFLNMIPKACECVEFQIRPALAKARFWAGQGVVPLNERQHQTLAALLNAGPRSTRRSTTTRKHATLTGASKPTACRDLTELVALGCLVEIGGGGRSTAYDLPWAKLHGLEE